MDFLNTALGFKKCFLSEWGGESGAEQLPTSHNNPGGLAPPSGPPSKGCILSHHCLVGFKVARGIQGH